MDAAAHRQDAGMKPGWQRDAGVADRIGPLCDAVGILDRGAQQGGDVERLDRLGKLGVEPLGILTQQVNLFRIRAELGAPLNAHEIANEEPACWFVPQPEPTTMLVLPGRRSIEEVVDRLGHGVHGGARLLVVG